MGFDKCQRDLLSPVGVEKMNKVDEYVNNLEAIRKERCGLVIDYIRTTYPDVEETITFSPKTTFPVFKKGDIYVGIGSMKGHISIHFAKQEATKIVAEDNPKIKAMVGCVNIKDTVTFPLEKIKNAIDYCFKFVISTVDEYILQFSSDVQTILQAVRTVVKESAPMVEEKISYQMPTFVVHGNLVYFAAYTKHIGFYPGASVINAFQNRLTEYKFSKGAIQFPIEKPLPYEFIREMIQFKVEESIKKAEGKKKKR